jgi:hypothetical protein
VLGCDASLTPNPALQAALLHPLEALHSGPELETECAPSQAPMGPASVASGVAGRACDLLNQSRKCDISKPRSKQPEHSPRSSARATAIDDYNTTRRDANYAPGASAAPYVPPGGAFGSRNDLAEEIDASKPALLRTFRLLTSQPLAHPPSRSSRLSTLPDGFRGSASRNVISFGTL